MATKRDGISNRLFMMKEKILHKLNNQKGHVGFWFKNMITGEEWGFNENDEFLAASVIKLPMFMYLSKLNAEGRISMEEMIKPREEDRVPICGALTLFRKLPEVSIGTLCNLMISLSDNMAINLLIDRLGIEEYQKGFKEMGLEGTVLRRKLFDEEASAEGVQNTIVPGEMGMLLEQIYRREFVNPKVSEEIEDVLCLQQIEHKICGRIRWNYRVAHKTGEDDNISNDVGLVYGPQPFVVCFVGNDLPIVDWEDFIRRTVEELVVYCS